LSAPPSISVAANVGPTDHTALESVSSAFRLPPTTVTVLASEMLG
jgi:NhaP-type Na+/H+ or K+/H+ antiporter